MLFRYAKVQQIFGVNKKFTFKKGKKTFNRITVSFPRVLKQMGARGKRRTPNLFAVS